ncbi:hypothetical protein B0H19DRAFT_1265695 [Mycena capillaripes]|nr:hypothetical protein B0H19DRAFT_1265695 [Mycena capillaripes]
MTKTEFFPTFAQFMAVFQSKERGRLRRCISVPSGYPGNHRGLSVSRHADVRATREERQGNGTRSNVGVYRLNKLSTRDIEHRLGSVAAHMASVVGPMLSTLQSNPIHGGSSTEDIATLQSMFKDQLRSFWNDMRTLIEGIEDQAADDTHVPCIL